MTPILRGEARTASRASPAGIALLWLAGMLAVVAGVRAWLTVNFLGESAGCGHCLAWPVLAHDAWLLAPAWLLLALAVSRSGRLSAWMFAFPCVVLLWLMALDVAVLATLGMRLYLLDVFKFGGEGAAIGDFIAALLRSTGGIGVIAAAIALALPLFGLRGRRARPRAGIALITLAALAAGTGLLGRGRDPAYIQADAWLNLVELHLAQGVNTPYSHEFVRALATAPAAPPPRCVAGQARRPDLLVVAVESLSSYQSAVHGGPLDFLPELDALTRRGTWFAQFHANGFTTDAGLIALLAGRAPVPAVGRYRSLDAFRGFDDRASVPALLEAAGYETAFFTTGNLGFLDKAPWLEAIGFRHWEGAEHPFYAGWPRGGFDAAEDRALYLRLLQWLDQRDPGAPAFAFALTVQSHPPFIDPATRRLDEGAVFRATDRALGDFVRELDRRQFFRRGVLLITGDHRSMTPLQPEERRRYGHRAFARVPLVVLGDSGLPPGRIDLPFSQTDLLPSLADLVSPEVCLTLEQGRFLRAHPEPPRWILHARGDLRDRVDVFHADGNFGYRLDGDRSEWVGAPPPDARLIEATMHRDRIRRGALDSDIADLVHGLGR